MAGPAADRRGGPGKSAPCMRDHVELGVEDIPMIGVAKGVDRDLGKEEFHGSGSG